MADALYFADQPERGVWNWYAAGSLPEYKTREEAEAGAAAHAARVIESSPEVAALRARVAELEAANEDLRRWVAQHEDERAAVTRALKDATDAAGTTAMHGQGAAAQPKPRDESVPPPGWVAEKDRYDDEDEPMVSRSCNGIIDQPTAWRIYDAEHGYAPPASTRAADAVAAVFAAAEERCAALPQPDPAAVARRRRVQAPPEVMPGQWGWEDDGTLANDDNDIQLSLADADTLRVTTVHDFDVCCSVQIPFAAIEMLTGREAAIRADERARCEAEREAEAPAPNWGDFGDDGGS